MRDDDSRCVERCEHAVVTVSAAAGSRPTRPPGFRWLRRAPGKPPSPQPPETWPTAHPTAHPDISMRDIPCQMPEAQTSAPRGVRDAPHRWPLPYRSAQALTRRRGLGRSRGSDYNGACRHWGRFAHCPLYERHPPAESVRDPPTCPVICTPHPLGVSPCRSPTCRGRPRPACRRPPPAGRPRYVSTRPRSPGRGRDRSPRREPARAAAPGCGPAATAARHRRAGPA
jgi:hypothetical protein